MCGWPWWRTGGLDDAPEISMPVAFPWLFKANDDWDFTELRQVTNFWRSVKLNTDH